LLRDCVARFARPYLARQPGTYLERRPNSCFVPEATPLDLGVHFGRGDLLAVLGAATG
jgi:hypothetical protein